MAGRSRRVNVAKVQQMAINKTSNLLSTLWGLAVWLTGILVALAVGFGMIWNTLTIPWLAPFIIQTAGWFVVILTILGVLLKIIDMIGK